MSNDSDRLRVSVLYGVSVEGPEDRVSVPQAVKWPILTLSWYVLSTSSVPGEGILDEVKKPSFHSGDSSSANNHKHILNVTLQEGQRDVVH